MAMIKDIVGGGYDDVPDTELDDAIERIVGDYIGDSLLRLQLSGRILAEVMRRTGLGPYDHPSPMQTVVTTSDVGEE